MYPSPEAGEVECPVAMAMPLVHRFSERDTNGASTNEATANFMFFDRGTFCAPICQHLSKSVDLRTLFRNLSKLVTFAATPLVSTPLVRNQ